MKPTREDREREPYRWCVFCDADCDMPPLLQEHAEDCPTSTGVFVVREVDMGHPCPHCGERPGGFSCVDCETPLKVGDRYMHRVVEPGDPSLPGIEGASVNEVICVGCAAQDAIAEVER